MIVKLFRGRNARKIKIVPAHSFCASRSFPFFPCAAVRIADGGTGQCGQTRPYFLQTAAKRSAQFSETAQRDAHSPDPDAIRCLFPTNKVSPVPSAPSVSARANGVPPASIVHNRKSSSQNMHRSWQSLPFGSIFCDYCHDFTILYLTNIVIYIKIFLSNRKK